MAILRLCPSQKTLPGVGHGRLAPPQTRGITRGWNVAGAGFGVKGLEYPGSPWESGALAIQRAGVGAAHGLLTDSFTKKV